MRAVISTDSPGYTVRGSGDRYACASVRYAPVAGSVHLYDTDTGAGGALEKKLALRFVSRSGTSKTVAPAHAGGTVHAIVQRKSLHGSGSPLGHKVRGSSTPSSLMRRCWWNSAARSGFTSKPRRTPPSSGGGTIARS